MDALAAAALAGLPVLGYLLVRRVRGLAGDLAALSSQVEELTARLQAAEQDVAAAVGRAEVAEAVLLEKGLADEEDLEAARRRFDDAAAEVTGSRDLH